MPRLLVFQHVSAEPLGTLDALIRSRGHRIRFHNFERHPGAQPNVDRYRGLIVLGGPMNVEDREHRAHLKTELLAIERALEQNKPVLGICLGAQLLAHALGAPVRRHERSEVGWYDLTTTHDGRTDSVVGPLGAGAKVFQWHHYSYNLPAGAVLLASTPTCQQQAFRFGRSAYGFQFHLEVDPPLIARWLALPAFERDLRKIGGAVAEVGAATPAHCAQTRPLAEAVFNGFLDLVGRPSRRIALPSRGAVP
jgi:GMP synthase (glutamine-hydrolysing)